MVNAKLINMDSSEIWSDRRHDSWARGWTILVLRSLPPSGTSLMGREDCKIPLYIPTLHYKPGSRSHRVTGEEKRTIFLNIFCFLLFIYISLRDLC